MEKPHELIMIHYVSDKDDNNPLVNVHTHGILENFEHPDLQIVLPLEPKLAMHILNSIVDEFISKGKKLVPNKKNKGLLQSPPELYVMETTENERTVYRLVFPDAEGNFPWDEMSVSPYSNQLDEYDLN